MNQDLTYIIVTILVPLIPAYIIYRTLPSQTVVRGPFKGLQIQLGGAFGGYFLLVLCIFAFITMRQSAYTIYTVEGKIRLKSAQTPEAFSLYLSPPTSVVLPNGEFTMRIPIEKGKTDIPRLLIESSGYETACINLAADAVFHPFWKGNKIAIQTPVEMAPVNDTPYRPEGAAPPITQN